MIQVRSESVVLVSVWSGGTHRTSVETTVCIVTGTFNQPSLSLSLPKRNKHRQALTTVVMSLSDYDTEYRGGLYVATNHGRYALKLNRGDAVMHQSDLLHGVQVDDLERHPIYPHAKTYVPTHPSLNFPLKQSQQQSKQTMELDSLVQGFLDVRAVRTRVEQTLSRDERSMFIHVSHLKSNTNTLKHYEYLTRASRSNIGTDGEASWIPR